MNGKVVNCKTNPYDVYIGRPTKWGNPFKIGKDGNRKEVLQKYYEYLKSNTQLMVEVQELKGKVLGCWCKPKACHGDMILRILNELEQDKRNEIFFKEN